MSNKVLIGVVLVMLVLIVILISIVANAFKDNGSGYKPVTPGMITKEEEEQSEKNYANLIDKADKINSKYKSSNYNEAYILLSEDDRKKIDNVIDEVLNFIETKNVDEIYDKHLSDEYIQAMFPSKEELGNYLDSNFGEDAKYSIKVYEISGNTLFLPIVETKLGSDIELSTFKVANFLDPEYSLYFDNVQSIFNLLNVYRKNDFDININYGIYYLDHCSIIFQIRNRTDKVLDFDFDKTYLEEHSGKIYKHLEILGDTRVSVGPGKIVLYEAKFPRYKIYPKTLYFNIKYGDKTINDEREYLNYNLVKEE